jgi:hypothetical protein
MNGGTKTGFSTISLKGLQSSKRWFRRPHRQKTKKKKKNKTEISTATPRKHKIRQCHPEYGRDSFLVSQKSIKAFNVPAVRYWAIDKRNYNVTARCLWIPAAWLHSHVAKLVISWSINIANIIQTPWKRASLLLGSIIEIHLIGIPINRSTDSQHRGMISVTSQWKKTTFEFRGTQTCGTCQTFCCQVGI